MTRTLFAFGTLLLVSTTLAAPAPEPFVSGWSKPIDPDNDCKFKRDKGTLTIEMPGNEHDYEPVRKRFNAPRLVREIEGDFYMEVRVQIDCRPSAQSSVKGQPSYVGAGFLLIPPDKFGVISMRWDYRLAGQEPGTDGCAAEMILGDQGGQRNGVWSKGTRKWLLKTKPEHLYISLERVDDVLGYRISSDRKNWVTIGGGQFLGLPSKLKVGLASYSTSKDPSKVRFDQLKLTQGKKKS